MMIQSTSIFLLASENEGFRLNPNILETNVINIGILLVILFFSAGKGLQDILNTRYESVITGIQDSEKQLTEATERLTEARSQWVQAQISLEEMQKETENTKISLLETEIQQAHQEIAQRFTTILQLLRYRETQVLNELIKEVSRLALRQVATKLQKQLGEKDLQLINDSKIKELGGKL
jgi:F-type H+-transporting ATPase subunit b